MSKPRIKILVCNHKKAACLNNEAYMPIQVGRLEVDYDLGFQTDADGDNIGHKHFTYSEYSGIYWAWKNLKNIDYIGWCHYRRYFCLNEPKSFTRETLIIDEKELFKMDFSTEIITKYLEKYDIILPNKRVFPSSVWKIMNRIHGKQTMEFVEETLQKMHPAYMTTFNKCLKQTNRLEQLSIFITRSDLFKEYCNWLYPILEQLENHPSAKEFGFDKERKIAFIAEQLTPVYFHHNQLKIKHLPVAWVNPNAVNKPWWRYYGSNIKSTLRFWFNI